MAKGTVQFCIVVMAITGVHAVKLLQTSSIQGKALPANEVVSVSVVQGNDSMKVKSSDDGIFGFMVTPGTWKLFVDAKEPYKDVILERVTVMKGSNTSVGVINLQK